jgi:hypothetical protein
MYGKQTIGFAVVALLAGVAMTGTARADQQTQTLAAGASDTSQLMNKDQNGAVSRQAFMNFMAAEYDTVKSNKADKLEVSEVAQPEFRKSSVPHR